MLKISAIKIENLTHGCVTDRKPNISFSLESDVQGESLRKAMIRVGNWEKETTDQINNRYEGNLHPFTEYTVTVHAVGISGEETEKSASFEMGRLGTPWQAKWITDASYDYPEKVSPVPMTFRKDFAVTKKVRRALVNSTALGVYELQMNGRKVGEDYFAPGFTSYEHQIQYQTYDVTSLLSSSNRMTAVVAGGWAAGSFTYHRKNKISANRQAFLLELRLEYEDGTAKIYGTDESWQVTENGPYRMAEWYDGETYDSRVESDRVSWKAADVTVPRGTPELLAQYGSPVRVKEVRNPVTCFEGTDGELVYDFGQNFAGVICARIHGRYGQKIVFHHAEVLVNGRLFLKSLRTAKATATYFCKDGDQTYSPRLTYMGFRYVGVSGINKSDLELSAFVLSSDMDETGTFTCSNPQINRLNENIRWGGYSNFVDIPTDCPQRDERQGWTGDIAVFARTACYNFDMSRFLDKWLTDVRSEQGKGGGIPMVVPRAGDTWPVLATSCWGDSCVLVPWAEYLARGDLEMLRRQYPTMKNFLKAAKWWSAFLSFTPSGRHVWRFPFHFGDWCAPGETVQQWLKKGKWVGTSYFANSCGIVAKIADLLGEKQDAVNYRRLREKITCSYRKVFTDGSGKLKKEFQTAYVLPLYFGMTKGAETKIMANNLARLVREGGNHLTTGFTGTPYLLFALSDNGHTDVAYDLLLQDTCPSWLYEVKTGGTTIWERWDALRSDGTVNIGDLAGDKSDEKSNGGMVSFNHYAMGAVGDWLYRRIAGIEPTSGGYRTFRVAPVPGGGITFAKGTVKTPYGRILSDWSTDGGVFSIQVEVPVSTQCTLILPNGEMHRFESGIYCYSCRD